MDEGYFKIEPKINSFYWAEFRFIKKSPIFIVSCDVMSGTGCFSFSMCGSDETIHEQDIRLLREVVYE